MKTLEAREETTNPGYELQSDQNSPRVARPILNEIKGLNQNTVIFNGTENIVSVETLEEKVRTYCKEHDMDLPSEEVLSVMGTLVLEPHLEIGQAIRKSRRLSSIYSTSLDEEDWSGRTLLDRIAAPVLEEEDADVRALPQATIQPQVYTSSVRDTRKSFIAGLFELRGSLISEILEGVPPRRLDALIEVWERGSLKRGRKPISETERELVDYLCGYTIMCRQDWLLEQIGEENARRAIQRFPRLVPITTMDRALHLARAIGISDRKIASYPNLLFMSPIVMNGNHQALRRFGLSDKKIATEANLLLEDPKVLTVNYELLRKQGLSEKQIATSPSVLKMRPRTVKDRYQYLANKGINTKKITGGGLLTMNPDTIEERYGALLRLGIRSININSSPVLLTLRPETINSSYRKLKDLGISDKEIQRNARLLLRNPVSLERNYQALKKLGLSEEKIARCASLLICLPETIERNHQALQQLGLTNKTIISNPRLLVLRPETIERNYRHQIELLRGNHTDRNSGRDVLVAKPLLLGTSPAIVEANIQYLSFNHIEYFHNEFLLATTVQSKRRKLAWMLRELLDYRDTPFGQRRKKIERLYKFVSKKPRLLLESISLLEKRKVKLKEKMKTVP